VEILRLADNIVLLPQEHGTNIKQGSLDKIQASGLLKSSVEINIDDDDQNAHKKQESNIVEADLLPELEGAEPDEVEDLSRRPLDLLVYKYYFKSIELLKFSIFLFFAALQAISSSFSSERSNLLHFRYLEDCN
jgi:hypothetical protein